VNLPDQIDAITAARHKLDQQELDLIDTARNQGLTWQTLAPLFGYSAAQGIQQHHKQLQAVITRRDRKTA
jgi:hypothetical protein